jgi:aldehyde dehydrogenase (NAD+)
LSHKEPRLLETQFKAQLYIDGESREASDGGTFPVVNPADQREIGEAALGTSADAEAAVEAAHQAFPTWAELPAPQRAELLYKVGQAILEQKEELARLLTMEEGKVYREALSETTEAYKAVMYYAGEGRRMWSYVYPSDSPQKIGFVVRRPLGVALVITPFNFPISTPVWGIAPALVTGNTVIFKPASTTPLIGHRIVQLFAQAGLPRGVLNFITGPGATVGETLINNPRVKSVHFTGESATGKRVAEVNAEFFRRQCLELGGKNPLLVAKDCPVDTTVSAAVTAAFGSTGQRCTAASRLIVEEPILEEFTRKFTAAASKLRVGDGLKPGVEMGPLVTRAGQEKTRRYVRIGLEEGAKLLAGGREYADGELSKGFFYPPTVFSGTNDMRIAQDEIFGPVTTIIPAKNVDDAIELANETRYGLSSALYTKDLQAAFKAIWKIDAGVTFINGGPSGIECGAPFGGIKDSGYGQELGETALDHYTEKKTIWLDWSYEKRPWYFPWQ